MAIPFAAIAGAVAGIAPIIGKLFKGGKGVVPGALAGGGVAALFDGGTKKRRRRRKRLTNTEIQELLILKQIVGTRSPLLTIAGLKMLSRGG